MYAVFLILLFNWFGKDLDPHIEKPYFWPYDHITKLYLCTSQSFSIFPTLVFKTKNCDSSCGKLLEESSLTGNKSIVISSGDLFSSNMKLVSFDREM